MVSTSPAALKAGAEAVERAVAAGPKTEREKDYIAAIAAFYRDSDKLDHHTRAVAYEKAMEQVYLRYPEDREAAVFYGLALNASALPTDKTYANQRKAAEILNKVWAEQPNHPGVVHYLIHSDDSPEFAAAGLDAAICYSKVAPDVPHALHMPSHIFTRLGMWQQSIDSNRAAHAAAVAYVRKTLGPESFDTETVHTMDYLEYAYLQTAQDSGAKEVVDELTSFRQSAVPNLPTAYAVAAIPIRYALERRDWPAAAALSEPAIGFPLKRFPWAEAMIAYARALGDARTGNIAGAEAEIGAAAIARRQAEGQRPLLGQSSGGPAFGGRRYPRPCPRRRQKGRRVGAGRGRSGRHDGQAPCHPVVGAAGARAVGRSVARTQPAGGGPGRVPGDVEHRSQSLPQPSGEARAAKQTGDSATAHDAYRKLVALSKPDGPARPELAEARSYLTN